MKTILLLAAQDGREIDAGTAILLVLIILGAVFAIKTILRAVKGHQGQTVSGLLGPQGQPSADEEEEEEDDEDAPIAWSVETRELLARFIVTEFANDSSSDTDDLLECGRDMVRAYTKTLEDRDVSWTDENRRLLAAFASSSFANACSSDAEELFENAKEMLEAYLEETKSAAAAAPSAAPKAP